ncbi:MAG: hypothetical protein WCG59_01450 [Actinomycetes bacterium]
MKKWLLCVLAGVLLVSGSVLVSSVNQPPPAGAVAGNLSDAQLQAVGAPPCPVRGTCVAMPCPNPVHCGVVEAAPTDGIGPDQWVYLKLYGFSPSAILQVNYCSLKNANPSDRLCAFQGTQLQAIPTATIQTLGDGSINYSFQAQQNVEDPSSQIPCTGIGGQIPGVAGQVFQCLNLDGVTQNPDFKQFYCDQSGNNNCAIVVVDPALGSGNGSITPSSSNSVAIPLTFESATGNCAQATQLITEGEAGIDLLLGAADVATCRDGGSGKVVPFNTTINGLEALKQLEKGALQMAFTDDAQGASQQEYFKRDGFLSIPIALSATTVGYRGQMSSQGTTVPQSGINLSSNMVAGIISGVYSTPQSTDISKCTFGDYCQLFSSLNDQAGYSQADFLGAYLRSDTSGTTDQTLSWICKSPAMTMTFAASIGGSGIETVAGEQILLGGFFPGGGAPSGCLLGDQFPAFVAQNQFFGEYSTPSQQSLKLTQFIASCSSGPCDGFGLFNWAEAAYYGFSVSGIQNASSNFVAPSNDSIAAGVKACTWNGDGVCTPDYTNSSQADGYPMTTVISAVVPRNPNLSATDKANIKAALTSILDSTASGSANPAVLPTGMVPLPDNIMAMSRDEIANGVGNPSYSAPNPAPNSSSKSGSQNSSSSSSSRFSSSLGSLNASAAGAGKGTSKPAPTPSSSPTYGPFTLSASMSRLMLPATMVAGALLAVLGVMMMVMSAARRRIGARPASDALGDETSDLGDVGDEI